ncbi:MAG: TolC family protein [Acidobacteria bacterium]|nr:TolC family protein [Acidobacteriota bacterium]
MKTRTAYWSAATLILAVTLFPAKLGAQQQAEQKKPSVVDYTRTSIFPNFFEPYVSPIVSEEPMSNSQRLQSLIRDGKLQISVDDAVALALENNLDIAVARYGPSFAQTDIVRTKSGGAGRGVSGAFQSQALFAGAIGGGISGGGGGGQTGAGGAFGGGGATNVGSVGSFDPVAGFNFGWDRRTTPLGTIVVTGVPFLTNQTTTYSGFFGQQFQTGTSYVMGLNGSRQSTTSLTALFNPQVVSSFFAGFNQPLLQGFGYRANSRFIRISKINVKIADSVFRQQVITTVSQILTLYWDLVVFRENVRVAERSLALAEKTLSDNKRQVEIGTLAPIEVVRAESEVATRQQELIVAQTNLRQQQTVLKTALAKQVDDQLAAIEIEPTNPLPEPKPEDIPPVEEALKLAAQNRPELEQADFNLQNQTTVIKANRNSLLPRLDIFASYSGSGLSGNRIIRDNTGQVVDVDPNGVLQALTQTIQGQFPDYSFGLSLQFPIRNRAAQADAVRALLEERQLKTQLQRTKNQVAQEVRNAEIALIQAKAQIEAARKAVVLARQTLDAEQKKFQLGESTVFLVIQAQRDLVAAEVREVQARSTYAKALTQFSQTTGTTLQKYRIELSEALEGKVARTPNIPGTPDRAGTFGAYVKEAGW